MTDDFAAFAGIDDEAVRKERAKARELRKSRWWRDKISRGICYYCGKKTAPARLTMDHIVPLARGGKSVKGNLVVTCKECNNKKRTMLPIEWQEYMDRLKEQKV